MDLETKFKKVTGFDAYADNDLRPKVPSDYYVEWLEEQLTISGVVKSLPTKEVIISEAIKYQDEFLDDPHSIADEAFIEGCNFILTALQEEKVIR